MDFGLSRITRLIRDFHPRLPWKAIHIAGTNGKGTTSALVSGLLHNAGTSVGRFNSPHLIYRHDCITINEKTIDKDTFAILEREITKRNDDAGINATSFELLTATAFEAFTRYKVAVGVVECGLGGEKDATNVLSADEVICSIITSIGMDHTDLLGNSIEAIAYKKAGIAKKDVPMVADVRFEAAEIVQKVARAAGTDVAFSIDKAKEPFEKMVSERPGLDFTAIQLRNLALAYSALAVAREFHNDMIPQISFEEAMEVAMKVRLTWRGRLQWTSITKFAGRKSDILIDGAHNQPAMRYLWRYIDAKVGQNPVTWVIAMSGTRNVQGILSHLIKAGDRVVFTQFGPVDGMPWVAPVAFDLFREAVEKWRHTPEIKYSPTPGEALRAAVRMTPEDELIVVTGSLYLVADVLRIPSIGGTSSSYDSSPPLEDNEENSSEFRPFARSLSDVT